MSAAGYRLGLVFVTGSAVAWSTAGFFTRLIPLDSWTMLAWRGIFGAIAIALVIFALEGRKSWLAFRTMGLPGWMFAGVSAIGMIFFITSLRHTTVAHGAVIYATVPFVAAGLSWLVLNEKPIRSAIIASLFALAGVALMMGLGVEGGLLGDVLAFGLTVCMAIMMVIARRYQNIPIMPAACLSALLSGLVCWPLGDPLAITSHELLILALFGIVNSAVGLALFTLGARHLPAIETALIGSLDAPQAPLWVWLAFKETPGASTIIGALIVFAAVCVHLIAGTIRRKTQLEPAVF